MRQCIIMQIYITKIEGFIDKNLYFLIVCILSFNNMNNTVIC